MPNISELIDKVTKPPRLEPGDIIGITAPSSQIDIKRVSDGMRYLQELGYRVVLGNTIKQFHDMDFTSAPDDLRAEELMQMFTNDSIKAIITARGGFGAQQILPLLDYDEIARHPKIFMGFSDTTALNIAIYQRSNLVTFNGPTVEITSNEDVDKKCLKRALDLLSTDQPWGVIENFDKALIRRISNPPNKVSVGRITGGNLTMCATSMGTPFELMTHDHIVIFEEIGETPYEVERTIEHMKAADKLEKCNGIIFGEFVRIQTENSDKRPDTAEPSINEILIKKFGKAGYPVLGYYNFSHGLWNLTIPLGIQGRINSDKRTFEIIEGVCV